MSNILPKHGQEALVGIATTLGGEEYGTGKTSLTAALPGSPAATMRRPQASAQSNDLEAGPSIAPPKMVQVTPSMQSMQALSSALPEKAGQNLSLTGNSDHIGLQQTKIRRIQLFKYQEFQQEQNKSREKYRGQLQRKGKNRRTPQLSNFATDFSSGSTKMWTDRSKAYLNMNTDKAKERKSAVTNKPPVPQIQDGPVLSSGSRSAIKSTGLQAVDSNQDPERQLLEEIYATIFFKNRETTKIQSKRVPMTSILYKSVQSGNDVLKECIGSGDQVCWIHFPANNMSWVHSLMIRLGDLQGKELLNDLVLGDEYCAEQQIGDHTSASQVKYMAPMCTEISTSVQPSDSLGVLDTFAIFMPYLQWEKYLVQTDTRAVIEDITQSQLSQDKLNIFEVMNLPCSVYEKLLRMYLDPEKLTVPIHPRRTLDQAYYTRLDTRARDDDQVVFRYTRDVKRPADGPSMIMVDQCWLCHQQGSVVPNRYQVTVVLICVQDIVISCFPEPEHPDGLGKERQGLNNADDRISSQINNWLSQEKNLESIEKGYDLAVMIMDSCASSVVLRGGIQNRAEVNEAFQRSIGNIMDKQTELFKLFLKSSRFLQKLYKAERDAANEGNKVDVSRSREHQGKLLGSLLNITKETKILREIKDIMDELTIIAYIDTEQSNILKEFSDFPNPPLPPVVLAQGEQHAEEPTKLLHRSPRQVSNTEKLVATSKERTKMISDLYDTADQAYKAIIDLLNLKQKHANMSEARSARLSAEEASRQAEETTQQGYSIMLFTVVTIVFLPLSSLAAIFSLLQVADVQMAIGISLAYIFPISSFVIALSFLLAFHRGLRAWTIAWLKAMFGKIGDVTGFDRLFDQNQTLGSELERAVERRKRAQLFERKIEDASDEDTDDSSDDQS